MSAARLTQADAVLVLDMAHKLDAEIAAAGPYEADIASMNRPRIKALRDLAVRLDAASIAADPVAP